MLQNISIWQLLILLAIVILVFGTKRLRNLGGDLGSAIRGFRKGLKDDEDGDSPKLEADPPATDTDTEQSTAKRETAQQD